MKPQVVIWGADNYNTLGLIRSLSVAALNVTLLITGRRQGVASASKYATKCHFTQTIEDGGSYLINNFPKQTDSSLKAVLIPGGDTTSLACARYYDELKDRFHLMCTTYPNTLIRITDKNEMGRLAAKSGVLTPAAQEYHVGVRDFNVPFPIILKPVQCEGRKEFKVKVFNTTDDLINFEKYLNPNNRYLMQQYIDREYDVVIYGCKLPTGELCLAGHHILERWSDDGGGSYGHLSPEIPGYIDTIALDKLFDTVGYHGLFSAEYGFENGKAYFYEVNLRNDGFCHLSYQAGANLPLLWVCSCLGLPFKGSYKMTKEIVGINEIYDIANVLHGKISWRKYKHDRNEAQAFHFYDKEDQQPYKNMHRRMFWEIPFRAVLKTIRPQIVWFLNKLDK